MSNYDGPDIVRAPRDASDSERDRSDVTKFDVNCGTDGFVIDDDSSVIEGDVRGQVIEYGCFEIKICHL